MTFVIVVCCALAVGFLVGMLTVRRSGRWCPTCGRTLSCGTAHLPAPTPAHRP